MRNVKYFFKFKKKMTIFLVFLAFGSIQLIQYSVVVLFLSRTKLPFTSKVC